MLWVLWDNWVTLGVQLMSKPVLLLHVYCKKKKTNKESKDRNYTAKHIKIFVKNLSNSCFHFYTKLKLMTARIDTWNLMLYHSKTKKNKNTNPSPTLTWRQVQALLPPHALLFFTAFPHSLTFTINLLPFLCALSPSRWLLLGDCQADSSFLVMQTQTVQLTCFCISKLCTVLYLESYYVLEKIPL